MPENGGSCHSPNKLPLSHIRNRSFQYRLMGASNRQENWELTQINMYETSATSMSTAYGYKCKINSIQLSIPETCSQPRRKTYLHTEDHFVSKEGSCIMTL